MLSFNIWLSAKWQIQILVTTAGNHQTFFRNSNRRDPNLFEPCFFSINRKSVLVLNRDNQRNPSSDFDWTFSLVTTYYHLVFNKDGNAKNLSQGYCYMLAIDIRSFSLEVWCKGLWCSRRLAFHSSYASTFTSYIVHTHECKLYIPTYITTYNVYTICTILRLYINITSVHW